MKTIGLIGGTSWESTAVYYRLLNEGVRSRLGGLHSARLVLTSLDFAPLAAAVHADRWDQIGDALSRAARQLEAAGADCIALCTNTMHKVADRVVGATALPFVSLLDVTGRALARSGSHRPLLLATRPTMEPGFYRAHLAQAYGIDASVPDQADRETLNRIIFDELCRGEIRPASKQAVLSMIAAAQQRGCDGVIFGCTEIGLLLSPSDVTNPVFDTTVLHCEALLDFAVSPAFLLESNVA